MSPFPPSQAIELDLHAVKGIGKDHAKFSPVATASYRLLPHIIITDPIPPEHVVEFQGCFAPGVIGISPDPKTRQKRAVVKNPRKDTVSREVLRNDKFKDKVELTRIRDHFICTFSAVVLSRGGTSVRSVVGECSSVADLPFAPPFRRPQSA